MNNVFFATLLFADSSNILSDDSDRCLLIWNYMEALDCSR